MKVAAGHKARPFTQPPFPDFVRSLMGIVTMKHSFPVRFRIIHDLSWPPQDSVNDHINPDAFRCFYGSFDDAVALVIKYRVGALSAKSDLADAFKYILIRSQDWSLLGHPGTSSVWTVLLVASTMWTIFSHLGCTDALQYAMKTNKVQDLLHYLDDYFTVGPPHSSVCANNIANHDCYMSGTWLHH